MVDLTDADIRSLAKAAGVEIPGHLLSEVEYLLNGVLETLANVDVPGLDEMEPLPILLPPPAARS